jgi:hypothetical protein
MKTSTFSRLTLAALAVIALGAAAPAIAESSAPRDAASGQATGKRQHQPAEPGTGEEAAVEHSVKSPRDAASGQATGKRAHKPMRAQTTDADNDGAGEAEALDHQGNAPRDVKTGQSSGKRMHKPMTVRSESDAGAQDHNSSRSNKSASVNDDLDSDNDGISDGDAQGKSISEKGVSSTKSRTKSGSAK